MKTVSPSDILPGEPNSVWSQSNKAKALKLIKEGKMTTAGLAVIEEAKKNGRWESASRHLTNTNVSAASGSAFSTR